jgi:hypothetical protein
LWEKIQRENQEAALVDLDLLGGGTPTEGDSGTD